MSLNFDIIGAGSEPAERSWTETDVLLYALAVGAGQQDPLAELEFTTENSIGGTAYFRTTSNGIPVLDRGSLTFTS